MEIGSTAPGAGNRGNIGDDRLSKSDALEFASFVLSDEHSVHELQAFMRAWKGAIDFQSKMGNKKLAAAALQMGDLIDWLALIQASCLSFANSEGSLETSPYKLWSDPAASRSLMPHAASLGGALPVRRGRGNRRSKLIYASALCFILLGFFVRRHLGQSWKHLPSFDATAHNGGITEQVPARYIWQKLHADYQAVEAETDTQDWEGFRAEFLSRQAHFDDLMLQRATLDSMLNQKRSSAQQSACDELAIDKFEPAIDAYITNRRAFFAFLRSAPTKTTANSTAVKALLAGEHDANALMSQYVAARDARGCDEQ